MATASCALTIWILLLGLEWVCLGQTEDSLATNVTVANDIKRPDIEDEILGPLRVWHVVFISVSILFVILVIVCCCLDIRVPRTRQEIEYNYQKRLINDKYLRALERNPDEAIKEYNTDNAEDEKRRIETISQLIGPKTLQKALSPAERLQRVVKMSTLNNEGGLRRGTADDEIENCRKPYRPKKGIGAPLPLNPKDILALVAQQKQNRNTQL